MWKCYGGVGVGNLKYLVLNRKENFHWGKNNDHQFQAKSKAREQSTEIIDLQESYDLKTFRED